MKRLSLLLLLLFCLLPDQALAQASVQLCNKATPQSCATVNSDGTLNTTVSNAASITIGAVTGTGTAGTAAANPITVQGIASMTPLLATGTGTAGTAATGVVTVQGVASMTPLLIQVAGSSFTNITTNADTNVKGSAGTLVGLVVNTAGTNSTVKLYNDADGTCNTGLIGTYSTTALVSLTINATATVGLCATTAGDSPANITVLWR